MPIAIAPAGSQTILSPDKSLTVLLSTESLLFAVFALTFTFGTSALVGVVVVDVARKIAVAAASVLTILGAGAVTAWIDLFLCGSSPDRFAEWFPAVGIAVAAVSQPIFAWTFVINLLRN